MQDLTKGSISAHLFKTASFMLVTMVFQTLYFLVDLYWVGRLGKEAVAGGRRRRQPDLHRPGDLADAGRRHDHAGVARGGPAQHERALLVFNQSQVLSMVVGALVPGGRDDLARRPTRTALSADAATAQLAADYLLWFLPAMGLQFALVAMGSALRGIGNFKPGMVVQTATVIINIVLAPILIFGWVTGRPMGVAGAALATLIAVVVGVVWLATYFVGKDAYLRFVRRDMKPQLKSLGRHAEDRAAGRRRVRADGGLPDDRLRGRRGRSAPRHRPASASACASCRRCSCRSSRSASRWRRWPARTSARGPAPASRRCSRRPA